MKRVSMNTTELHPVRAGTPADGGRRVGRNRRHPRARIPLGRFLGGRFRRPAAVHVPTLVFARSPRISPRHRLQCASRRFRGAGRGPGRGCHRCRARPSLARSCRTRGARARRDQHTATDRCSAAAHHRTVHRGARRRQPTSVVLRQRQRIDRATGCRGAGRHRRADRRVHRLCGRQRHRRGGDCVATLAAGARPRARQRDTASARHAGGDRRAARAGSGPSVYSACHRLATW